MKSEAKDITPVKTKAEVNASALKYQRDKDREMVKGIFRFHEAPGAGMGFVYKQYKEDQVERFDFIDGEIYTIPLGVAKHLNKNLWYPEYGFIKEEQGVKTAFGGGQAMRVAHKVRRASFQSLEFIEDTDLTPVGSSGIVNVELIPSLGI